MSKKKQEGCISSIVDTTDFFGGSIQLTLHGKDAVSTTLGGLLTILVVVFIIYETTNRCLSMFRHEDPQIYQINELDEDPALITLSRRNNFFLAMVVTVDSKNINITEASPFNYVTTYNHYTRIENGSRISVKRPVLWAPCNQSDFPDDIYGVNSFSTLSLNYGYCVYGINYTDPITGKCPDEIPGQNSGCILPPSFDILGTYLSENFDFIQLKLTVCNSSDPAKMKNIKCDKGNIMQKFGLVEFKLSLFFAKTLVDPTSYENSNKTVIDSTYWTVTPQIYKVSDIFVDRLTLQDYDSYFSADSYNNKSYYTIQTDKIRDLEVVRSSSGAILLEWNLRRSSLNLVIARTYSKIQDFLTDLGGFSKALMFLAGFIALSYARYKYNLTIANDLFDFDLSSRPKSSKRKSLHITKERSSTQVFSDASENRNLMIESPVSPSSPISPDLSLKMASQDFIISEAFNRQARKKSKLDDSSLNFLKSVCRRRKNPHSIMELKAVRLVQESLDLPRIVRKLKEVDRLKILLLNHTQSEAFDFIEKPLVTCSQRESLFVGSLIDDKLFNDRTVEKKNKYQNIDSDFKALEGYEKLYVAYRYLKEDRDPSNLLYNRKLLAMMNQDLVKLFKRVDQLLSKDSECKQFSDVVELVLNGSKRSTIRKYE